MKSVFTFFLLLFSATVFSKTQDSSAHYFQKGLAEKTAKRYIIAAACFDKAIQFNSKFTAAYIENGFVNKEMKRMDVSLRNFTKAHELDPGNEVLVNELVELYFNFHQYQNVIDLAQKCITCDHKDRMIALSYFQLEDFGNAEIMLSAWVKKNPNDAGAIYTLARTYLEMGSEYKAILYYEKAIQLDTSNSKWFFELGSLYYNTKNFKNAVVCFNKAASQGYKRSNDFNENLGFAYIYSNEFEKGEKLLKEAIARKPNDKDLVRDIAEAFYDSKMYDKCLDYCQQLLEKDMEDGKALYQAGLCFQKKGQTQRGKQMCDKAIELDPSLNKLRQKKMGTGI